MTDGALAFTVRLTSVLALENPDWDLVPNMKVLGSGVLRSDSHSGLMSYSRAAAKHQGCPSCTFKNTFILVFSMCMDVCLCVGLCIQVQASEEARRTSDP